MTQTTILIVEYGASWESWAQTWCGRSRQLIILIQQARESTREFQKRIVRSLDRMRRSRIRPQQIVLMAGKYCRDGRALLARTQIIRLVLASCAAFASRMQLVLDAGQHDATSDRCFDALVEEIRAGSGGPANSLEWTSGWRGAGGFAVN